MLTEQTLSRIGTKMGRLTLLKPLKPEVTRTGQKPLHWEVKCDCGVIKTVRWTSLRSGGTRSCGCLQKEMGAPNATHKMTRTPIYGIWAGMIARCYNKNVRCYKNYGGRGIEVCSRWFDFELFYQDMGDRPEGKSLDRIDVNGNYCKENCRWASTKEQGRNTRTNKIIDTPLGKMCLTEAEEKFGVHRATLADRYNAGLRGALLVRKQRFHKYKTHV